MYEEKQLFGVVKGNMVKEVESYTHELYNRAISYINNEALPTGAFKNLKWGENIPSTPEMTFESLMKKRQLGEALVWKCVMLEADRMTNQHEALNVGKDAINVKRRLIIHLEILKDQVTEMVEQTDFGFLEHMDIDEIRTELIKAYKEEDIPAIIFYICSYSLHMQMRKISGVD
jgi:hypothetical protein